MDLNVLIISQNQTSLDFWNRLIRKDLKANVALIKLRNLQAIHHLVSSYTIVVLDEYFLSPIDERWILETTAKIKQINQQAKVFGLSPYYADPVNLSDPLLVDVHRFPLCDEFIIGLNQSIENRLITIQKIAV